MIEKHFTIIIPGYNVEKWINQCLESALKQNYKNFDVIFIDADSTDNTNKIVKDYCNIYSNLKLIKNDIRKYQIENIKIATLEAKKGSICGSLDGDDWLKNDTVLSYLNGVYYDDVWMTYGLYEGYPYRDVSENYHVYPNDVIENNSFREYRFLASHLRTFRKELFLKIADKDLQDDNGVYFDMTGDVAIMIPMLEMAGFHSRHIREVLYVYNCTNPISDYRLDEPKQVRIDKLIRSREKYNKIEKL